MKHSASLGMGIVFALVLVGPLSTRAGGPGSDAPPTTVEGTLRVINSKQGLIQLSDGLELRVNDPRQLEELKVGDPVRIVYEQHNGRNVALTVTSKTTGATTARPEVEWIAPDGVTEARSKQDRYECLKESASLHQQDLYPACMEARGYRQKR